MKRLAKLLMPIAVLGFSGFAMADPWRDESGNGGRHRDGREYKQEYWDGNCKVKRESKKDGEYKEERECKSSRRHAAGGERREFKEEYRDGACKVEREFKKDGEYKEKRECKPSRSHAQRWQP